MRYPSSLTTAEAVARQLSKASPGSTPSPELSQYADYFAYISEIVPQVSNYIEGETGVSFVPYKEDKDLYFIDLARDERYDPRRRFLWLPDDLLSVNSITWNGTALSATDYRLHPTDSASAWGIYFNPDTALTFDTGDFNAKLTVSGYWGLHDAIGQMWTTVESVSLASSSVTSITVVASSAYEVWQYLRCESEYMQVTNKPNATTLTVSRGVNGTTAAAHTTQSLQTYMPAKDIRMAATRLAAFMYEKRTDVGGVVQIGDASFRLDSMPPAVKEAITRRRKLTFGSV